MKQNFEMQINIEIRQTEPYSGGSLRIMETHVVSAESFLELATILSHFHELAVKLAAEKK